MTCCKAMGMTVPLLELSTVLWESTLMHLRQEGAGVRARTAFGKVVNDRLQRLEGARCISPED